jgi:benzoylformate decarboxylase
LLLLSGGQIWRHTLFHDGVLTQRKIWLGSDTSKLDLSQGFDVVGICDPREALEELAARLGSGDAASPSPIDAGGAAVDAPSWRRSLDATALAAGERHPSRMLWHLLRECDEAIVVDESSSLTTDVRTFARGGPGTYFKSGSGTISWGVGAVVGVAIAAKPRPVVGFIGDGSIMYGSESLWTASKLDLDNITVFVLANGRYQGLNNSAAAIYEDSTISWDLFNLAPLVEFSALADAYGWRYAEINDAAQAEAFRPSAGRWLVRVSFEPDLVPVTFAEHY